MWAIIYTRKRYVIKCPHKLGNLKLKLHGTEIDCKNIKGTITLKDTN